MYNCRRKKYCQMNQANNSNNCGCNNNNDEEFFEDVEFIMDNTDSCECGFDKEDSMFPLNPVLAQSYVPIQKIGKTFTPNVGLKMGTIYPELVSPYAPCQSMEEIAFIKAKNTIGEGCNKC